MSLFSALHRYSLRLLGAPGKARETKDREVGGARPPDPGRREATEAVLDPLHAMTLVHRPY